MRLKGKAAIVTGTGDGIGRGIAVAFAREGAAVALCDVNETELRRSEELVRGQGADAWASVTDVSRDGDVRAFVDEAARRFGRLDILVHNAAVMPVAPIEELDDAVIDRVLGVNLKAAILLSKYATPHMRAAGGGAIIHMGSVTGHQGHAGVVVYGATKGALMALARGQAVELARDRIRVNTVSPGTVDSPMLHRFLAENARDPVKARQAFDNLHPRGCCASVEEIAAVFTFLASDDSVNITGEDIRCDGGYVIFGRQPRE